MDHYSEYEERLRYCKMDFLIEDDYDRAQAAIKTIRARLLLKDFPEHEEEIRFHSRMMKSDQNGMHYPAYCALDKEMDSFYMHRLEWIKENPQVTIEREIDAIMNTHEAIMNGDEELDDAFMYEYMIIVDILIMLNPDHIYKILEATQFPWVVLD